MSCRICVRSVARLCGLIPLVVILFACSERGDRPPLTPPAPTPSAPSATYTLSGIVSTVGASGSTVVSDITVRDSVTGQSSTTDTNGFYRLSGLLAGQTGISASGKGYVQFTRVITISADASLDIELGRIPAFTLSGVVFEETETGRSPVEAVSVYCDACGEGHAFSTTDAQGFYSFTGVLEGPYTLIIWKAGYTVVGSAGSYPDASGTKVPLVEGDTRYDIQLVRQ